MLARAELRDLKSAPSAVQACRHQAGQTIKMSIQGIDEPRAWSLRSQLCVCVCMCVCVLDLGVVFSNVGQICSHLGLGAAPDTLNTVT